MIAVRGASLAAPLASRLDGGRDRASDRAAFRFSPQHPEQAGY